MAANPFTELSDKLDALTLIVVEMNRKMQSQGTAKTVGALLNAEQAAEYLDMAKATIYVLTHKREIPHVKRGKRIFFYKDELDSWVGEKRQKTANQIRQEM